MDWVAAESGVAYGDSPRSPPRRTACSPTTAAAMTFLIADGVTPSNEGRGYIARRIIRRAVQQGQRIGLEPPFLPGLPAVVIEQMGDAYPGARRARGRDRRRVVTEEERFRETLAARAEGVRGACRAGGDLGRRRVRARDDVRLPDRADRGARRGTRPAGRHRPLPRADGGAPRGLARGRREERPSSAPPSFSHAAGFRTEFVGYEKTDVLTAVWPRSSESATALFLAKLRSRRSTPTAAGR